MKASPFEYHAPREVDEAVALIGALGDGAKVIAGGQSLVPMMALRLTAIEHLVDISRITGLRGTTRLDGALRIGATTTQAAVERDAAALAAVPLLREALPHIGHFQIRNRGTIGGSIAHADPASELPAVALALEAQLEVVGPGGERVVEAADFFEGTWTTTLEADEVLAAVRFPQWPGRCGFAVEELARRHGDFAIAGAVVAVQLEGTTPSRCGIALFGVGSTPLRAPAAEQAVLAGADPVEVGKAAVEGLEPPDDLLGSGGYRRHVTSTMVQRAVRRALEEAGRA